jgi:hypothetical protein
MTLVSDRSELIRITGYKQRAAIIRWLKENRFQFYIGGDKWPRVVMPTDGVALPATLKKSEPNSAALMELQHGKAKKRATRSA